MFSIIGDVFVGDGKNTILVFCYIIFLQQRILSSVTSQEINNLCNIVEEVRIFFHTMNTNNVMKHLFAITK